MHTYNIKGFTLVASSVVTRWVAATLVAYIQNCEASGANWRKGSQRMKVVKVLHSDRGFISKSPPCLPIVVVTASGVLLMWRLSWIGEQPINLLQVQETCCIML